MDKKFKEMKLRSQKFGKQNLKKNFRNRTIEIAGMNLREGN